MALTSETILALSSDAGSISNGKKLATLTKWQNLNAPEGMLWGECKGSGKDPYLVGVDLNGLVSKCSCPSRKFPCKHALALMLLSVNHASDFGQQAAPESLQTWLKGREQRAENKEQKAEEAAKKEADPAAQAKRRAAREKKVTDGLAALDTFLKDLVRDGLAQASSRPYSDWDTQAARLVDAQASGAARLVRRIPEFLSDPPALLTHLARLHLLCEAWTRRSSLSEAEQADLRTAVGFPVTQAEVLAQPEIKGTWAVLAQFHEEEENLIVRRTWLRQVTGEHNALLLDFAPTGRPLPPALPVGTTFECSLCFVPSAAPLRAVLKGEPHFLPSSIAEQHLRSCPSFEEVLEQHAQALSRNPWLERTGAYLLPNVLVVPAAADSNDWLLQDQTGHTLPLRPIDNAGVLLLLAQTGGKPAHVLGELNEQGFNISSFFGGVGEA